MPPPERSPYNIYPNLPRPPDKDADAVAVITWAQSHTRAVADLFRRFQHATISTGGVAAHAPSHSPQTGSDPLVTAAHSGGYGTTTAVGVSNSLLRADTRLFYPEALAAAADRTRTLTLTVDGSNNPRLTSLAQRFELRSPLADGGTAQKAFRVDWNVGVALPTNQGKIIEFGYTDNASTFIPVATLYPRYSRGGVGGHSFLVDRRTGATARLGFKEEGTETAFSGFEMASLASAGFYLNNTQAFTCTLTGLQLYGSATPSQLTTANNFNLALTPRCSKVAGSSATLITYDGASATFLPTDAFVLTVADGVSAVGDTPRFQVRTRGRGVYVPTGDYTANEATKGFVCKDSQAPTPEYWRLFASVSGATVKDATITIDAEGFASFTRAASATGSVILNVQDAGTSAP